MLHLEVTLQDLKTCLITLFIPGKRMNYIGVQRQKWLLLKWAAIYFLNKWVHGGTNPTICITRIFSNKDRCKNIASLEIKSKRPFWFEFFSSSKLLRNLDSWTEITKLWNNPFLSMPDRVGGSQFYIGVQDPVSEEYYTYTGERQYYFNWDAVYTPLTDWHCVMINYDSFKWREVRCLFPKLALCSKTIPRGIFLFFK